MRRMLRRVPPEITKPAKRAQAPACALRLEESNELSGTHLRYLYAIYEISRSAADVRSASVAEKMRVSRPSVARMLGVLMEKDLIEKEPYGKIHLTETGLRMAKTFDLRVRFLEERIPRMELCLSEVDIFETACAVAAILPDEVWRGTRQPAVGRTRRVSKTAAG